MTNEPTTKPKVKRLRRPRLKDGELRMYWGREPRDTPDVMVAWQSPATKRESNLLFYHLCSQRPDPAASPLYSKMLPSFIEALKDNGYDLTALQFSIMKKPVTEQSNG